MAAYMNFAFSLAVPRGVGWHCRCCHVYTVETRAREEAVEDLMPAKMIIIAERVTERGGGPQDLL